MNVKCETGRMWLVRKMVKKRTSELHAETILIPDRIEGLRALERWHGELLALANRVKVVIDAEIREELDWRSGEPASARSATSGHAGASDDRP